MGRNWYRCETVSVIFTPVFIQACGVVPKSCKQNISFFFFFLSFLSIRIICIRMLHLFQRAESIYERQAGLSLSLSTHFYLVCVQTTNEARCKIKMCDAFLSQKQSVQAEALLSHKKQQSLVNTELLKIMTKIILNLQTNQKHFYCFWDYDISKSNE